MRIAIMPLALSLLSGAVSAEDPLIAPIRCADCATWNEAVPPVRLYGQSWYVGVGGLSSVLIATSQGLVLIDGDLPQSAPLIEANIAKLGFRIGDVKLILLSHEHFDHAGGVAALQRDSGARVLAGPEAARALTMGHPTESDPQYHADDHYAFPKAPMAETVADGQVVTLGDLSITAHRTPGHTPGGTSWSWKSGGLNLVYADSLTAVTTNHYRFTEIAGRFRASIAIIRDLPCDILISTHPGASDLWQRVESGKLIDSDACRAYADAAERNLDRRLAEETSR